MKIKICFCHWFSFFLKFIRDYSFSVYCCFTFRSHFPFRLCGLEPTIGEKSLVGEICRIGAIFFIEILLDFVDLEHLKICFFPRQRVSQQIQYYRYFSILFQFSALPVLLFSWIIPNVYQKNQSSSQSIFFSIGQHREIKRSIESVFNRTVIR